MPERLLGDHPARNAAYIMIVLSLMVVALAGWNVNLTHRVGVQESIRRAEQTNAAARERLACRELLVIVEVSLEIPLRNLSDILDTGSLTAAERADKVAAKKRYQAAWERLRPAIEACVTK